MHPPAPRWHTEWRRRKRPRPPGWPADPATGNAAGRLRVARQAWQAPQLCPRKGMGWGGQAFSSHLFCGSSGGARGTIESAQFAADTRHIGLGPGHGRLELGHAVQIALGVARFNALLLGLAVGVLLLGLRQTLFGFAQLRRENDACIAVASALLWRVYALLTPPTRGGRGSGGPAGLRSDALHDGDVATLHQLAATVFGHLGVVGVFVAAAVNAFLGLRLKHKQASGTGNQPTNGVGRQGNQQQVSPSAGGACSSHFSMTENRPKSACLPAQGGEFASPHAKGTASAVPFAWGPRWPWTR